MSTTRKKEVKSAQPPKPKPRVFRSAMLDIDRLVNLVAGGKGINDDVDKETAARFFSVTEDQTYYTAIMEIIEEAKELWQEQQSKWEDDIDELTETHKTELEDLKDGHEAELLNGSSNTMVGQMYYKTTNMVDDDTMELFCELMKTIQPATLVQGLRKLQDTTLTLSDIKMLL